MLPDKSLPESPDNTWDRAAAVPATPNGPTASTQSKVEREQVNVVEREQVKVVERERIMGDDADMHKLRAEIAALERRALEAQKEFQLQLATAFAERDLARQQRDALSDQVRGTISFDALTPNP